MSKLRRIVCVRHGETTGESSTRYHGATDVPLSDAGRARMREVAKSLTRECFDLVVASSLRRSWEAAWIVSGGAPVRLEPRFREIDFGRWEGLTKEEIAAADPQLHELWQAGAAEFDFPGGETRAGFRERTLEGLQGLQQSGATSVLVVAHKGTVRTIAEELLGSTLEDGQPQLGACIGVSCAVDGTWHLGRRGSNPAGLEAA
ncbi:MAG: histidine phosphatase family protein [Deltaproteobacteria bacterium]|nr:histidine phosphatase family protein [Deltaproteobacteria bacterium]MBW2359954.1 histidine phosphatase family protein [Deltaproteobacteria bacterium]